MNVKRVVVLGVVGAAMIAWFAAASTTGTRPAIDPVVRKTTVVELRGAELAAEIARLHERLRPGTAPQTPGRNLFEFSRRAPARLAAPLPPPPAVNDPVPMALPAPAVKLIGIAEDPGADGPLRTAIISGFGQVFLVKIGERVADRYEVAKISSDAAQLTDLGNNSTLTLVLK
jgi:hypothetical protein